MLAPEWSEPALKASLAALPRMRASTAGESAVAAAAWLLSGREIRFSTRRRVEDRAGILFGTTR
jgi:hypothetical protein